MYTDQLVFGLRNKFSWKEILGEIVVVDGGSLFSMWSPKFFILAGQLGPLTFQEIFCPFNDLLTLHTLLLCHLQSMAAHRNLLFSNCGQNCPEKNLGKDRGWCKTASITFTASLLA